MPAASAVATEDPSRVTSTEPIYAGPTASIFSPRIFISACFARGDFANSQP